MRPASFPSHGSLNPSQPIPAPGKDLLAALLEEIPCGVALFALDGSLLHFNKEARRLLEEKYPELARGHYADYASVGIRADGSDYPVEEYALARCLRTGRPQAAETMGFRLADGRTAWAIFAATPVFDPADGRMAGAAVSFVDITERKLSEEVLAEREGRLRTITENVADTILQADRQGRITYINRVHPDLAMERVLGSSVFDYVFPEEHARLREVLTTVFEDRRDCTYESTGPGAAGAPRRYGVKASPVIVGDTVASAIFVARDITDQRATEATLKYLLEDTGSLFGERFLASLVRHIGSTFGVRYCVVGDYDPAHAEVAACAVAVGGQEGAKFRYTLAGTPCADALRKGEACHHPVGVTDLYPEDHLLAEMGVSGYFGMPLRDPGGMILGILVLMDSKPMPIGAEQRQLLSLLSLRAGAELSRIRMDGERARLLELERSARAEAEAAISVRDIFLSVASHELNTPLAALQLQIDGLQRAVRGESAVKLSQERLLAALEHADVIAGRFRRLVGTLLDATQISGTGAIVLDRADHDLVEIAEEAIDHLSEPLARAGCDVTWSEVEHIRGSWDRFRITQCVINLLSNAMKYGRSRPIELSVVRRGGFARLVVRDHGVGVHPKDRDRIFERFERAHDRHYGGLGLGLYIVRQIVRGHGGTIHVESVPGEGAAFHVDLPIVPPPS